MPSTTDFSTIFFFNIFISLLLYSILFLTAPLISDFYGQTILRKIIRISALTIVIGSFGTIQSVILTKDLDFKRQTYISFTATIISGTVGVIIAYNGLAYWALVFQTMAGNFIRITGLWITSKWRPIFIFNWQSLKELYKYGYKIFLTGLSDIIFTKLYFPLIGKYFSATQLGFYTNATSFSNIIVKQTTISYGRVLFPAISSIQENKERLSKYYSAVFRLLSFVMFPISLIAIISSHSFISFFLTAKWLPAVPYMQLFLTEGFFFALYMLNQNTFNAIGYSGLSLKVELLKKSLVFISLFISFKYGIRALIIGQLTGSFIAFIVSLHYVYYKIQFKIKGLIEELFKLIIISLLLIVIDYTILLKNISNDGLLLIARGLFLTIFYLLFGYLFKVKAMSDLCVVFNKSLPKWIKMIIKNRIN